MTKAQIRAARKLLIDRRTSLRFPCNLQAACQTGGGKTGVTWQARVRNLSCKGAGLVLPRLFSAGTLLTVHFQKPGQKPFRAAMQVVHSYAEADGGYHGCSFVRRLTDAEVDALVK